MGSWQKRVDWPTVPERGDTLVFEERSGSIAAERTDEGARHWMLDGDIEITLKLKRPTDLDRLRDCGWTPYTPPKSS